MITLQQPHAHHDTPENKGRPCGFHIGCSGCENFQKRMRTPEGRAKFIEASAKQAEKDGTNLSGVDAAKANLTEKIDMMLAKLPKNIDIGAVVNDFAQKNPELSGDAGSSDPIKPDALKYLAIKNITNSRSI